MNSEERLPMESNEDYLRYRRQKDAYNKLDECLRDMRLATAAYENEKAIRRMEKVDIWLLRLVLVLLLVTAIAQIIILW